MRLLPVFFHGFFMLTCPSSCLLTGAVATLLTANSSGYCSTRLLSHPLGRRRLAALATFLEFGSLPLVALQPTSRHLQPAGALMAGGCCGRCGCEGWNERVCACCVDVDAACEAEHNQVPKAALTCSDCPSLRALPPQITTHTGVAPEAPMCQAAVGFSHLFFGLLLPTFLGVHYWQPPEEEREAQGRAGAAAAAGAAQLPSLRKWAACCGWLQRCVQRAAAAVDRQLYRLVGRKAQPALRALVCWYVLTQSWLLCRLGAGL